MFGQILTDTGKAIQDGRLKPVVIGPVEIPIPGQAGPAGGGQPQQAPGGDILGQILRDILRGAGGQVQVPRQALSRRMLDDRAPRYGSITAPLSEQTT